MDTLIQTDILFWYDGPQLIQGRIVGPQAFPRICVGLALNDALTSYCVAEVSYEDLTQYTSKLIDLRTLFLRHREWFIGTPSEKEATRWSVDTAFTLEPQACEMTDAELPLEGFYA